MQFINIKNRFYLRGNLIEITDIIKSESKLGELGYSCSEAYTFKVIKKSKDHYKIGDNTFGINSTFYKELEKVKSKIYEIY